MTTLVAPLPRRLNSSRSQARALFDDAPPNLSSVVVEMDLRHVRATAPSFVDELVRVALIERDAGSLKLVGPPRRTAELASAAAQRHGAADRLVVEGVRD